MVSTAITTQEVEATQLYVGLLEISVVQIFSANKLDNPSVK